MMLTISFYVIFLNKAMMHYGIEHVAMFGIVSRLESIATLPLYGLSVGAMTLVGMFYGAKKYGLLEKISWYALKISVVAASIVGVIFFIFPEIFLRLFTPDISVIKAGIPYLRLDAFTFPFMAVTMIIARMLQGMGHGFPGLMINFVRVLFVAVPLAYLFVFVLGLGYLSIVIAMILGGGIASGVGILWLMKKMHTHQTLAKSNRQE
jgi:Na+-driven multidrug efflux pump